MLETKELLKVYKPKKGVPVTALNKVSLKFPEKGMVFLLGKSGSGKSTLLNLLGGLDTYDGGEIIIEGISSKDFKQKHFDSYRNTYVGFIFQEYNVLDEFSVGANIALAIELQGRKAKDEEIAKILKEVDLEGFGNRKPNELSGGQKQRVAIARALVKNPQIIMADEPTGALDSATGKQVFDTLKKLSKDKLIIIVSHDRDFAEGYADRIIELADGNVISDVELNTEAENSCEAENSSLSFDGANIRIAEGYHLTEEDRVNINEYIDSLKSGVNLSVAKKGVKGKFIPTDLSKIKSIADNNFKLIKSKLPLKNAFKIGAGGLKYKKIRLVVTIILSCISFGLFGLSDTFAAYNHIKVCTNSIMDTDISYASLAKSKRVTEGNYEYWSSDYFISEDELEKISNETGIQFIGVHYPVNSDLGFFEYINPEISLTETDYNIFGCAFNGFSEINEEKLSKFGFKLTSGALPDGTKNEIALTEYICETFKKAKFFDGTVTKNADGTETKVYTDITDSSQLVGKKIKLDGVEYIVSGIIDTNIDLSRYSDLTVKKKGNDKAKELIEYALYGEFTSEVGYSLSCIAFVGDGKIAAMEESEPQISYIYNGYFYFFGDSDITIDPAFVADINGAKKQNIIWVDGEKQTLSEKEIIVTSDMVPEVYEKGNEAYEKYITDAETAYYKEIEKQEEQRLAEEEKSETELFGDSDIFADFEIEDTVLDGGFKIEGMDIAKESLPSKIESANQYGDSGIGGYKPDSSVLAGAEKAKENAYKNALKDMKITFGGVINSKGKDWENIEGYKIVGIIPITEENSKWSSTAVLCDSLYKDFTEDGKGDYRCVVGNMPKERENVEKLVRFCYERDGKTVAYDLQNSVTFELDAVNSTVKEVAKVFLYIGLGFALFAALMLSNFIATSISYKKQEIGILRAIGSRSTDVFKIFFAESFIIAMINFVLSSVGVFVVTTILNGLLRKEAGVLITILSFGIRQIILLLVISIFVALAASFLPVNRIARKRPIDAIRDR